MLSEDELDTMGYVDSGLSDSELAAYARADIPRLVAALREERAERERLEMAIKGSRLRANLMTFLWKSAVEDMRSDDPVEVRLRQDLETADESYQKLEAENALLRAEAERLRAAADGSDREAQ